MSTFPVDEGLRVAIEELQPNAPRQFLLDLRLD
jgi:hypothetical protein